MVWSVSKSYKIAEGNLVDAGRCIIQHGTFVYFILTGPVSLSSGKVNEHSEVSLQ